MLHAGCRGGAAWPSRIAALLVCAALPSAAQQIFSDDFETGSLLTSDVPDAGRWEFQTLRYLEHAISAQPAAARRGNFGLIYVDPRDTDGHIEGSSVQSSISQPSSDYFLRTWLRFSST